ncbi:MAG: hypothetical protein IKD46_01175, partial [Lentisphaeria bacterium]|nr:hypothetical protein [Lentisphaeria bacterium]
MNKVLCQPARQAKKSTWSANHVLSGTTVLRTGSDPEVEPRRFFMPPSIGRQISLVGFHMT